MSFSTPQTGIDEGLVQSLEWDTAHFERKIARIHYEGLSPAKLAQAVAAADVSAADCLYLLVPASDTLMIASAEDTGFRLADVRLTLGTDITWMAGMERVDCVRPFRPSDVARLKEIARVSHTDSRFFRDLRFSRTGCQRMYELWIEKSCAGWANFVLVADAGAGANGYITCHQDETGASIGLFAVSEEARGTGVGSALLKAACAQAQRQGASRAAVVTQGANPRAQRVYQRCGFTTESIELWFHWWRSS